MGDPSAYNYARWSALYDVNMRNSTIPLQREQDLRDAMGGTNEVMRTSLGPRQVDSRVGNLLVQLKTGRESLTRKSSKLGAKSNEAAIEKDAILVGRGYVVEWILEQGGSKQLLDALEKSGIKVHIGPILEDK